MKKGSVYILIGITIVVMILNSCTDNQDKMDKQHTDQFYKYKRVARGHSDRIPLIKPYEAIQNRITKKWDIDFIDSRPSKYNPALPIKLFECDNLNIIDSVIIAKCSGEGCTYDDERHNEIYFILIPMKKIEEVFFSYKDFIDFFRKVSKNPDPEFYLGDAINTNWQEKNILPWDKIDTAYERGNVSD